MATQEEIIESEIAKVAHDWVFGNSDSILPLKDRYISNSNYMFPLDMAELQRASEMEPSEIESRYRAIYGDVFNLPDKEKKKAMETLDRDYIHDSQIASLHETASVILRYFEEEPEKMLKELNASLYNLIVIPGDEFAPGFYPPEFEILNFGKKIGISDIEPYMIGKMRAVNGWIAYFSKVTVEWLEKAFKCPACDFVGIGDGKTCQNCGFNKGELKFIEKESKGRSVQVIGIMEMYEDSRGHPALTKLKVNGKHINAFYSGDRITAIGIIKTDTERSGRKFVVEYYLDILQMKRVETYTITEQEKTNVMNHKKTLKELEEMFAPTIVGPYSDIKRALLLQLVGSDNVKRNNIHILLIGDPGLGKSDLIKFSAEVSTKGYYVSDASAAGLTASITDMDGNKVMVPGVLVLANHGIACIDEVEKMKKDDREAIHPALEQGDFTKSKAGLTQTFETKTSLLAAANPLGQKWDASRTLIEQITLEQSLLDRFDAIFILQNNVLTEIDPWEMLKEKHVDVGFLKTYIQAAREFHTTIPDDIKDEIAKFYLELRKKSGDLSINVRTFQSMLRFTEASAKLNFHGKVTMEDFDEMKRIMESWLVQFNYSIDTIRGTTASNERWLKDAYKILKENGGSMLIEDLKKQIAIDEINWEKLRYIMQQTNFYFPNDKRVALT